MEVVKNGGKGQHHISWIAPEAGKASGSQHDLRDGESTSPPRSSDQNAAALLLIQEWTPGKTIDQALCGENAPKQNVFGAVPLVWGSQ